MFHLIFAIETWICLWLSSPALAVSGVLINTIGGGRGYREGVNSCFFIIFFMYLFLKTQLHFSSFLQYKNNGYIPFMYPSLTWVVSVTVVSTKEKGKGKGKGRWEGTLILFCHDFFLKIWLYLFVIKTRNSYIPCNDFSPAPAAFHCDLFQRQRKRWGGGGEHWGFIVVTYFVHPVFSFMFTIKKNDLPTNIFLLFTNNVSTPNWLS